jgi:phosphoglycerate dehydrogenase-like enzyme
LHRCAILDDYQNVALSTADWSRLAPEVEVKVFNDYIPTHEERVEALRDFDIVVAMRERTPFDKKLIDALPKLKLLITTGAYNASFDLAAAAARGIAVCGTGNVAGATAELAWSLILALVRNIPAEVEDMRKGAAWQPRVSGDLAGKQLGIIGLGRLGTRVAKVGNAFGMKVAAWSRSLTEDKAKEGGALRAASLDELLEASDIVTIHVPLNNGSRGLIGAPQLALMKPTAFLVNTSRGPIVEQKALIDALDSKRLAGAAIDVYDQEPLPRDHPLRKVERLLTTPHIGYVTKETYKVFYRDAVEDIAAWLKGAPVRPVAART